MLDNHFQEITDDIKNRILKTQLEIMADANNKLVHLYYNIGRILEENSRWGNKFIDSIATELKLSFPKLKGFSIRNLKYMKTFYNEYKNDKEFVQLVAQIPWKHNITLIQKIKNKEIRKWYINKCIEEGWSNNFLLYQIETNLHQRQAASLKHNNFNATLKQNTDLANSIMKDPYVFDLVSLSKNYKEKELENKMIERIKNVLLELGSGFSFVSNQYKITIDNQNYYIDLLFYHIKLKCYIAVELKVTEFKPEFASKMGMYLTVLDEQVRSESDNPSIGIILCQKKNNKIIDYTLKYSYTLDGEKVSEEETGAETITMPLPTFEVEVSAQTSYSVYTTQGAAAANEKDGSGIFDIAATTTISPDILEKYANLLSISYSLNSGESTTPESPIFQNLQWGKHTLTASVSFDGSNVTSSVNCDVTGIPYSFNFYNNESALNNTNWTKVNVDYTISKCTIQYDGSNGYLISPNFHIPTPLSVDYSIQAQYYRAWLINVSSKSIDLQVGVTSTNSSVATNYITHTCKGDNNTGKSYGTYTGTLDLSSDFSYISFYHNNANVSGQIDYLCLYEFTLQYK